MSQAAISTGVLGLLDSRDQTDTVEFYLDGDLNQMAIQKQFLEKNNLRVGINGGVPGLFSEEDFITALRLIWTNKVDGWWGQRYQTRYIRYGICSKEEFDQALHST